MPDEPGDDDTIQVNPSDYFTVGGSSSSDTFGGVSVSELVDEDDPLVTTDITDSSGAVVGSSISGTLKAVDKTAFDSDIPDIDTNNVFVIPLTFSDTDGGGVSLSDITTDDAVVVKYPDENKMLLVFPASDTSLPPDINLSFTVDGVTNNISYKTTGIALEHAAPPVPDKTLVWEELAGYFEIQTDDDVLGVSADTLMNVNSVGIDSVTRPGTSVISNAVSGRFYATDTETFSEFLTEDEMNKLGSKTFVVPLKAIESWHDMPLSELSSLLSSSLDMNYEYDIELEDEGVIACKSVTHVENSTLIIFIEAKQYDYDFIGDCGGAVSAIVGDYEYRLSIGAHVNDFVQEEPDEPDVIVDNISSNIIVKTKTNVLIEADDGSYATVNASKLVNYTGTGLLRPSYDSNTGVMKLASSYFIETGPQIFSTYADIGEISNELGDSFYVVPLEIGGNTWLFESDDDAFTALRDGVTSESNPAVFKRDIYGNGIIIFIKAISVGDETSCYLQTSVTRYDEDNNAHVITLSIA